MCPPQVPSPVPPAVPRPSRVGRFGPLGTALLLAVLLATAAHAASLVKDIASGSGSGLPAADPFSGFVSYFGSVNGKLLFPADSAGGTNYELWASDGTSGGTALVKTINPTADASISGNTEFVTIGSTAYFSADDDTHNFVLWKTDGTSGGTSLVNSDDPFNCLFPIRLTNANGTLYFAAADQTAGYELWKSDGTAAGTARVKDINPSGPSNVNTITPVSGLSGDASAKIVFVADNGTNGYELWKSDGTESGTVMIKDIWTGSESAFVDAGSSPNALAVLNNKVYFAANNGTNGYELWVSDGTSSGTTLLKDINAGAGDGFESGLFPYEILTNVNGTLYFAGDDGSTGSELWKSDGTAGGTVLVKDINPDALVPSEPHWITNILGTAVFSAADSDHGFEPWRSDGTEAGTTQIKDINSGGNSLTDPSRFVAVNGYAYFPADNGTTGLELWKTDGTESNTVLVQDIRSGATGSEPGNLTALDGTVYFVANDGANGRELWAHVQPTAAPIAAFTVNPSPSGTLLRWRTGGEFDHLGFNVYRDDEGVRTRLNEDLLPGTAVVAGRTPAGAGAPYAWLDPGSPAATYWLEAVDLRGEADWLGPFRPGTPSAPPGPPPPPELLSTVSLLYAANHRPSDPGESLERRAPGVELLGGGPTLLASAARRSPAAVPSVKLEVREEGWYRVTQPELLAAGLDASADPRNLQLSVAGTEVPIRVTGQQDGRFDSGDAVEFYGVGLDTTYSDTRVYWLVAGPGRGRRLAEPPFRGNSGPVPASFPYTVELRERKNYFPVFPNGLSGNFLGGLVSTRGLEQRLAVAHLAPGDGRLEVALVGVTAPVEASPTHRVEVLLNGASAGELAWDGIARGVGSFAVGAALREGENVVTLRSLAGARDLSLVDAVRLTYPRAYAVENDALRCLSPAGSRVRLDGFTSASVRVLDVTNGDAPALLPVRVSGSAGGYSALAEVPAGRGSRLLYACSGAGVRSVAAAVENAPSDWKSKSHRADLVILAPAALHASLRPLQRKREREGLVVAMVDVADVYDEFAHGEKGPRPIRAFLAATQSWRRAPKWVLLAGDASYDPRDYLGLGDHDLLPTPLVDTGPGETACDDWYADFDGDGLPELALGRLPARTPEQAAAYVAKLLAYEQAAPAPARALLVSDATQAGGFDFSTASERLAPLLPAGTQVARLVRGGAPPDSDRARLGELLAGAPGLVTYAGHGSIDSWSSGLLTSDDASALTARPGFWVDMTCLNGYFQDAALTSLAEGLLLNPRGGAVAVWASSGFTVPGQQSRVSRALLAELFRPGPGRRTLGQAAAAAKRATFDPDVRRTWTLFGDPSAVLR